ncbi:hypothetical protein LSH36_118g07043 [Paralvinella palmiformis]|uniref:Uncharacterized protein n=1 Tax=Paralvinella palmiformis TaxID=53620 RepID=A0AAD9JZK7_9ANNE|nr:hypothetical protein LSH36_118g07043 [Paralvinella palmiformis]
MTELTVSDPNLPRSESANIRISLISCDWLHNYAISYDDENGHTETVFLIEPGNVKLEAGEQSINKSSPLWTHKAVLLLIAEYKNLQKDFASLGANGRRFEPQQSTCKLGPLWSQKAVLQLITAYKTFLEDFANPIMKKTLLWEQISEILQGIPSVLQSAAPTKDNTVQQKPNLQEPPLWFIHFVNEQKTSTNRLESIQQDMLKQMKECNTNLKEIAEVLKDSEKK